MKQIIQSYKTGRIRLVELPCPSPRSGSILVETRASLVSVGTEKHMLQMAKKSLLGKALARPDLVKRVIDKARTEGIMHARRQAEGRLDTPVPLGYSASGVVAQVCDGVKDFAVGDRVAITGPGCAGHAEYNLTPGLLAVKIPSRTISRGTGRRNSAFAEPTLSGNPNEGPPLLGFDEAAFAALGGIALEAVRLSKAQLGDRVAVIGLGLIGQIAIQLLASAGCHVMGMDISQAKVEMAMEHGLEVGCASADELLPVVREQTQNVGVDSVIILAAAKSGEPLELAAEITRERGTVVASGLVNLNVPRKIFYEKELDLVVSRAWGPGLYDPSYSEKNIDYPIAYARWTANRNVAEFLSQLARGRVSVRHLISHRFALAEALKAYDLILEGKEAFLGVILDYLEKHEKEEPLSKVFLETPVSKPQPEGRSIGVGLIGAGLFANGTILPVLKGLMKKKFNGKIDLKGIATTGGVKARHASERFGFSYFTSDYQELLQDPDVDLVLILTRHGNHAELACKALEAGKHVYLEKPLCINLLQLKEVVRSYRAAQAEFNPICMVGFNRRFAPTMQWLKKKFENVQEPISLHITVNAGYVDPTSWVHDPAQGGGRIIGELCHFVDLAQYFCGCSPDEIFAASLASDGYKKSDNVTVHLKMEDGSIASILYVAGGDKSYLRERLEVFGGGAVGVIDNFKTSVFTRRGKKNKYKLWGTDRGHRSELETLFSSILEGKNAVPFEDYVKTTLTTFAIEDAVAGGGPVALACKMSELNDPRQSDHERNEKENAENTRRS